MYFGSGLHETFMLAYSQVDQAVRRKLEEMLKTWREPVPGSLSSTPVFSLSATQSIVEALTRFKGSTTSFSAQQQVRPSSIAQTQALQYRQTPTPPQQLLYHQPPQVHVQNPMPTPTPLSQVHSQTQYYQVY